MVLVPDQGAVQQLVPAGSYPACSLTRLPLFISAGQSACLSSKQTPGSNPGRIRPRVLSAPPQWQMDKRDISVFSGCERVASRRIPGRGVADSHRKCRLMCLLRGTLGRWGADVVAGRPGWQLGQVPQPWMPRAWLCVPSQCASDDVGQIPDLHHRPRLQRLHLHRTGDRLHRRGYSRRSRPRRSAIHRTRRRPAPNGMPGCSCGSNHS